MAGAAEIPDDGVRQSSADREALREALLDGTLSPAEVAERWPAGGKQAALIRSAFEQFDEWGYDTSIAPERADAANVAGDLGACDAAIDHAREAVDELERSQQAAPGEHANAARWYAEDATRGTEIGLDLDGGAW